MRGKFHYDGKFTIFADNVYRIRIESRIAHAYLDVDTEWVYSSVMATLTKCPSCGKTFMVKKEGITCPECGGILLKDSGRTPWIIRLFDLDGIWKTAPIRSTHKL